MTPVGEVVVFSCYKISFRFWHSECHIANVQSLKVRKRPQNTAAKREYDHDHFHILLWIRRFVRAAPYTQPDIGKPHRSSTKLRFPSPHFLRAWKAKRHNRRHVFGAATAIRGKG